MDRLKSGNDRDMLTAMAQQLIDVAEQMRQHD
jgi:hypothetical protein